MCGIVGYVGPRQARPLLLEGLEKLEYRGYDSAGISVLEGDRIDAVRAVGNLSALREAIESSRATHASEPASGVVAVAERPQPGTGIGHTRWATHGGVTEKNAHPHFDTTDRVHVVVNGIVENYISLKRRLVAEGADFTSETDAEVIAHLVAHYDEGDLVEAVRRAYHDLRGHYAFVAMTADAARAAGRGAQGVPAGHRPRRGRAVRRLGDPGLPAPHPSRPVHRERRDRRAATRRRGVLHARGEPGTARGRRDRLGHRDGREAGLRDLHAQGDPRAGGRRRRDDRRAGRARRGHRPRATSERSTTSC